MLKRSITYEDFNGVEHTEDFYFNLTKAELIEIEVEYEGGIEKAIKRIMAAGDYKTLVAEFKKIILWTYGEKSADGQSFTKVDADGKPLSAKFAQHAAYSALFIELALDANVGAEFVNGIMPADLVAAAKAEDIKKKTAESLGIEKSKKDKEKGD